MKTPTLITLTGLLALASGCNTPKHSNVLIFATNTKYAFDISYDTKMQQPNITLGYTRQEGVWMPLLANRGPDGLEPAQPNGICSTNRDGSTRPDDLYIGNDGSNLDTYSVIATFGAKFSAGVSGTNNLTAGNGLSQFFATGLAARELARNGGADLLSSKAPLTEGQATSQYIVSSTHESDVATFKTLMGKNLTSPEVVGGTTNAVGSKASDYANALAQDKGDTLPDIVNQPEHAADFQDILTKLQAATK
jgi:hypothetical protein